MYSHVFACIRMYRDVSVMHMYLKKLAVSGGGAKLLKCGGPIK